MAVWLGLERWWVYLAFFSLQFVLGLGIEFGYHLIAAWLDRKHPDDLPLTAGEWVNARALDLGLGGLTVLAAPEKSGVGDAYFPSANTIVLSGSTYAKNDVSFWAIGAHELGHAIVHRGSWLWSAITRLARLERGSVVAVGSMLMVANMWYRLPVVADVAFWLFVAALAGDVLVMIDEARASFVARGLLSQDPALDDKLVATGTYRLMAAFGTYLGFSIGRAILVLEWHVIAEAVAKRGPYVPSGALSSAEVVAAALASLTLVVSAVFWGVRVVRKAPFPSLLRRMATQAVRGGVALVLWLVVWDQPFGMAFIACCVLALYSVRSIAIVWLVPFVFVFAILGVVAFVVVAIVAMIVAAVFRGRGTSSSAGAIDGLGSKNGLLWEGIHYFACWPLIAAFWTFYLTRL